jgi:predicted methyltransferase
MKKVLHTIVLLMITWSVFADDLPLNARIESAMQGGHRSAENQARNKYRHPLETLTFLGLEDGMTVLEITPGGGWYSEILAPVMRGHGKYIVAIPDDNVPGQPEYRYGLNTELRAKFAANPGLYDEVVEIPFSPPQVASLGEPDSIDLVLTFRNTHGWIGDGIATQLFAEFARVLKPGGILGLVQHRAANGTDPKVTAELGYVSEEAVISMAQAAGLDLEARSEVNANPQDRKDYPEGVWTLPPSLDACSKLTNAEEKTACEAPYLAIGESDRMTLRFRKPVK